MYVFHTGSVVLVNKNRSQTSSLGLWKFSYNTLKGHQVQ